LSLSPRAARGTAWPADIVGGVGRGDVRALGSPLSLRTSPGGVWRLLPQWRAEQPVDTALWREGAVVARIHGAHPRRARRLHAPQQERHWDCRADHWRPLSARGQPPPPGAPPPPPRPPGSPPPPTRPRAAARA